MKVLSIRQPWAWAILHAGKDIENRSWPTKMRGRVLVHAGLGFDSSVSDDWIGFIMRSAVRLGTPPSSVPWAAELPRGGIVGTVEIVDCVSESASPWFFGPYGFVLRNPRPVSFIPLRGHLGFFSPPSEVLAQVVGHGPAA